MSSFLNIILWCCQYQDYSISDKMNNEHGAISIMIVDRWNQSIQRKALPFPLSPPWILPDTTYDWAWALRNQWLTTWALVEPKDRCHSEMVNAPALYSGCPIFRSQFRDRNIRLVSLTFLFPVFPQKSCRRTLKCFTITTLLVHNIFSLQQSCYFPFHSVYPVQLTECY
jgi:hypothetical protein